MPDYTNGYEAGKLVQRVESLEVDYKRIQENQDKLFAKLDDLIPAVRELRVKTGLWGGLSGLIAALATVGIAIAVKLL